MKNWKQGAEISNRFTFKLYP